MNDLKDRHHTCAILIELSAIHELIHVQRDWRNYKGQSMIANLMDSMKLTTIGFETERVHAFV